MKLCTVGVQRQLVDIFCVYTMSQENIPAIFAVTQESTVGFS